jgi:hypothetical protein
MRTPLLVSSALGLALALSAQTQPYTEGLQIFPGRGNDGQTFITRLGAPASAKFEGLVEYPVAFFEGIGDVTGEGASTLDCRLSHVIVYFQDQNPQTTHRFDLVMRPARSAASGPDLSASPVFRLNNLPSPPPVGTSTQPAGYGLIIRLGAQPVPIPCNQTVFCGMAVNGNSSWPNSDGLSLYAAYYDPAAVNQTSGDNVAPRKNVPNLTWRVTGSGQNMTATNKPPDLVLAYALVSTAPMLQVGAVHTRSFHSSKIGFGVAGMYPTINSANRQDGCAVRITDNTHATTGGRYLLFLALNTNSSLMRPPIHLGGLTGNVYLGPQQLLLVAAGALAKGNADTILTLAAPGQIPAAAAGASLFFQAATADSVSTTGGLTNLARVWF